jgi:hypothetical protein
MTEIDEETLRDQLQAKRNSLQKEFRMSPSNTRLALEIRLIDDLIASVSKSLQTQKQLVYPIATRLLKAVK